MTVLATDIEIGTHITRTFGGVTFNVDTIWSTVLAAAIVLGVGLYMARHATSGMPGKLQLAFETVVDAVRRQVEGSVGPVAPFVVPLAVAIFFFILISNWLGLIPSGHHPEYLPPPTADINLTLALALLVIIWAVATGIRHRRSGYFKGFFKPYFFLFPINLIEEVAKPFSLSLRLFGNLFAGGVVLALITLFPSFIVPFPNVLWKLFDMGIGLIQAFIFALLTILYFAFALGEGH
jgi:F-type H+-transporting ATPase subunit a